MLRKTAWIAWLYLLLQVSGPTLHAEVLVPPVVDEDTLETEAYRSGRGTYRSPAGGYIGGSRPVNPGTGTDGTARNPGVNAPGNRAPAAPAAPGARFGGFLGGLFAGSLLGSLLNPFGLAGFGTGLGPLVSLLFWGVLLYFVYRLFRRVLRGR